MTKNKHHKTQGTLVIIGGHEDKEHDCVILKEVVRLLDGGKLVIAAMASTEPQHYFEEYRAVFKRLGHKDLAELYLNDRTESSNEEKLALLDGAAGIFFTGGDQLRISSQIGDTPLEARARDLYQEGGVIAGTSAGASAMAETMMIRGTSGESFKIGDLHLAPGLGFVPDVIIDQHFAERGRIGRLLGAIALNPRILGIGIDEDTAVLKHDGSFSVIGSGAVYVVDGAAVTRSNIAEAETDAVLSISDVKMHVLSSGDYFDLSTRQFISHQGATP